MARTEREHPRTRGSAGRPVQVICYVEPLSGIEPVSKEPVLTAAELFRKSPERAALIRALGIHDVDGVDPLPIGLPVEVDGAVVDTLLDVLIRLK